MKRTYNKRCGIIMAELMVSVALLGVLLALLSVMLGAFGNFNHYQMTRQRCLAAAQAELDSIKATGGRIDNEQFERLWPNVTVSVEKIPGSGQWQNLTLVKVKTQGVSMKKDVVIELAQYLPSGEEVKQ